LSGAIKNLQAFIAAEVMEAEEEKAAMAKAGARHSQADQEHIQHIHDRSVHLGADCSGAAKMAKTPTDEEEDMEKLEEVLKGQVDILKRLEALEKENQELLARLKKVEDQPADPGKTRVVTKEGDLPPGSAGPGPKKPEDALGAIKKAHEDGPRFVI
jgi:hypothetical protein